MADVSKRTLNYFKETFGGDEKAIRLIWNAGYRYGLRRRADLVEDEEAPLPQYSEEE